MEFFRDTKFDFMGVRKYGIVLSVVLLVASILGLFVHQRLNIGIDFAGGTQLTFRFDEAPDVERLRQLLAEAGVTDPQIQRFGEEGLNEVLIKTPLIEGSEEGSRDLVEAAFDRAFNAERGDRLDLNRRGTDAVADLLLDSDPDAQLALGRLEARAHYEQVAEAILEPRREDGLIESWSELDGVVGVSPAARDLLEERAYLGRYAILGAENVGPQIGSELRSKGLWAVGLSLLGMMIYIWLRFELRFGIGAVVASLHDVLITLGLYAYVNYEFNLTTIAAFLTVVGYSVNDTVVIFDRVRENMRRTRRESLESLLNLSVNQTLSRTALTSGTTLLAVTTLYAFGGEVIRGFAFVIIVGVIVGTYSSVFVASPVVLWWERLFGREARAGRKSARTARAA
jgi:preprotein translocase subunit SecF